MSKQTATADPLLSVGKELSDADSSILSVAEQCLADGLVLKGWWERTDRNNGYAEQFQFVRQFNKPAESFGFFDTVQIGAESVPVMGTVEEAPYDQPKHSPPDRIRDEFREFLLHYFMRVSSFRQPEAYAQVVNRNGRSPSKPDRGFCAREYDSRAGFGFQQLYFKSRATGEIGKFSEQARDRIVDLREVCSKYEWIILKVRIFNFDLSVKPLGPNSPQLLVPLNEASYLIMSRDFIRNRQEPAADVVGEYGLGYAFIRDPASNDLIAYGPGHFDVAFQLINFRITKRGEIRSQLAFAANRPQRVLNVSLNPMTWGVRFADFFSFGMTSRLLPPDRREAMRGFSRSAGFDPVLSSIDLLDRITGGLSAREFCISKEELDRRFLVQHFMQHYQAIEGSLMTWRQIPDWLDRASLPQWVITGADT